MAEFFPLTAETDPKFVLFKHVLSFARIMSTLCPNVCRQTARIEGGSCPPLPPPSRTPMIASLLSDYIYVYVVIEHLHILEILDGFIILIDNTHRSCAYLILPIWPIPSFVLLNETRSVDI